MEQTGMKRRSSFAMPQSTRLMQTTMSPSSTANHFTFTARTTPTSTLPMASSRVVQKPVAPALSLDEELDLAMKNITDSRLQIYKQMADLESLYKKSDEVVRKVVLESSRGPTHSQHHAHVVDAFGNPMESESRAGGSTETPLVECFPTTESKQSNKNKSIPNGQRVQVDVAVQDLFM